MCGKLELSGKPFCVIYGSSVRMHFVWKSCCFFFLSLQADTPPAKINWFGPSEDTLWTVHNSMKAT